MRWDGRTRSGTDERGSTSRGVRACSLWRKRLLGVTGELSALVPRPLSLLEHSDTLTELVGRDTEQQALRDLVDDHRDVIIAGAPGCGKTRLCAELGDRVLFLERGEPHRVADDVREDRPTAVVVDDARGRGQQIELLRRIRVEANQQFSVIAVTWRAELEDVQRDLPGAAIVVLEPLERELMDTIIQFAGARSFCARHLILDQAEGRPGWTLAATNCRYQPGPAHRGNCRPARLREQQVDLATRLGRATRRGQVLRRPTPALLVPVDPLVSGSPWGTHVIGPECRCARCRRRTASSR
jgi:CheY-like chemotaxis protein